MHFPVISRRPPFTRPGRDLPIRVGVLCALFALGILLASAAPTRASAPVESLVPSSAPAGSPAIDLALRVKVADLPAPDDPVAIGVVSHAILWNGKPLAATTATADGLATFSARVPAGRLATAPGTRVVRGANCFADGSCLPITAPAEFTITPAPAPVLSAIEPDRVTAGDPPPTLIVTGSGFTPASVVEVRRASRPTTFVNTGRLTATLSAGDVATAGRVGVRVHNPARLGGNSNGVALRVVAADAPPSLAALAPRSATVGSRGLDLTVKGTGFDGSSRVRFDGVLCRTTFVNASTLVARVPATALAKARSAPVTVVGSAGGPSGILPFPVVDRPEILSLSPGIVLMDGGTYELAVTGVNFDPAARIRLDGVDVPTRAPDPRTRTTRIGPAQLTAPGAIAVRIVNPRRRGGASEPKNLVVRLAPEPVVPAVPVEPPTIAEVDEQGGVPGEVVSIVGSDFGRLKGEAEVLVGGVPAELAGEWGDSRIDVRLPDLPVGATTITVRTVKGVIETPLVVGEEPAAPPIANPVLLPLSGSRITFDASVALDPVTGAGPGSGNRANAIGLTGITAILWRFGDGSTSTEVAPTKAYRQPGTYSPSVTVTTDDGRTSTVSAGTVVVRRSRGGRLVATPPPVNFSIPSRVVFDVGSRSLRPESRPYLLRLAALVRRVGRRTEVGGHSDSQGSFEFNQRLSVERARAVREFLIIHGKVPQGLLTAVGYGETRPIDTNATPLGRQRNRRVELRIERGNTPIRLTSRQLLINQRISQVAIARANALERRLTSGLGTRDIRDGSLMPQDFGPSVAISGAPALTTSAGTPAPRLKVKPPRRSGKRLPVSDKQLLINQRISQAAVRRVNRLDEVLDAGLTGAAIRDGGLTPDDLAPDIAASRDGEAPEQGGFVLPALRVAAASTGKKVSATQEQLIINQRVSQAAIRRLNLAIARFEKGLTSEDFRDGSLSAADLPA